MPEILSTSHNTDASLYQDPLTLSAVPRYVTSHENAGLVYEEFQADNDNNAASYEDSINVEKDNQRQVSDLHTLLVSFPAGEQRVATMGWFPELTGTVTVGDAISIPAGEPDEQHAMLTMLLDRAIYDVGGREVADTILHYPGITTDQDLGQVRSARQDWVDVNQAANRQGPQIGEVIAIKTSRRMFEDIRNGQASWGDVQYGYLDKDQINVQKDIVAKLHSAFRQDPAMPSGHVHPKSTYVIPDARFGHLWRLSTMETVKMGDMVAHWAQNPEAPLPKSDTELAYNAWEATTGDQTAAARLDALFADPQSRPYVDAFIKLLSTAEAAIDSPEGTEALKGHRRQLNNKQGDKSDSAPYEQLQSIIKQAMDSKIEELRQSSGLKVPSNLTELFISQLG